MLSHTQIVQKRIFDILLSLMGLLLTWWLMALAWIVASVETRSNGLFTQERIGQNAKPFKLFKIKTMKSIAGLDTTVTASNDRRITSSGSYFRRVKIDELPQLFNVLLGSMSFVGPRPDVAGFADELSGGDSVILTLKPGITGPASIKYKNEEEILMRQSNPEKYNREVIWPDKVQINKEYIKHWSFKNDIQYIIKTIIG